MPARRPACPAGRAGALAAALAELRRRSTSRGFPGRRAARGARRRGIRSADRRPAGRSTAATSSSSRSIPPGRGPGPGAAPRAARRRRPCTTRSRIVPGFVVPTARSTARPDCAGRPCTPPTAASRCIPGAQRGSRLPPPGRRSQRLRLGVRARRAAPVRGRTWLERASCARRRAVELRRGAGARRRRHGGARRCGLLREVRAAASIGAGARARRREPQRARRRRSCVDDGGSLRARRCCRSRTGTRSSRS